MQKTVFSNRSRAFFLLTAIVVACALALFILSLLDIFPTNQYFRSGIIAPLATALFCVSMIVVLRHRFRKKAVQNGVTILLTLLAVLFGALCALSIWSTSVFGSTFHTYTSPNGERKIVLETATSMFEHYYTAYPIVFPGFYRLQGSGYIYLGESTGTATIVWEEDKAIITMEPFNSTMWTGIPEEERPSIIVDFENPKPWSPIAP
ncbi:MAG: hypothetical protein LUG13_09495 [Oscillospiraceae bacterium]|nr:hypothetical protein [Oscillospiraceae bacterium]